MGQTRAGRNFEHLIHSTAKFKVVWEGLKFQNSNEMKNFMFKFKIKSARFKFHFGSFDRGIVL